MSAPAVLNGRSLTFSRIPRPQTICANEVDITTTEYYQGEEQTALRVSYVTVTAERTVWIG